MFRNYLLTAWRNVSKHRLYTAINVTGLVIGLAVYLFGSLLADYERSHDMFYTNAERIYTIGSVVSPSSNLGVRELDGAYTAFAPLLKADVQELETVARTVSREYLLTVEDNSFYEGVRFADMALLDIFSFDYIEGDRSALQTPDGLLLTEPTARKLFGDGPWLGRTLTFDHIHELRVTAVIRDLPPNTHFNSSMIQEGMLTVVAPLEALNRITNYSLEGNWNNLSMGDLTYVMLPPGKNADWLQSVTDAAYASHYPDDEREFITDLKVRPLREINTVIWDMIGIPVIETIELLAMLVLIVAIVNYTNLATAQSLSRTREVGLRKTLGAGQGQLLQQFLAESVAIATASMLIALAVIEAAVPAFNSASGRGLAVSYLDTLPWLIATTLVVGVLAGIYPAWIITRTSPIAALRPGAAGTSQSNLFRSIMLGLQFAISIFMLAMVLIVYFQNEKVHASGSIYPRSQILTLERMHVEDIRSKHETIANELKKLPGVTAVGFSTQVPYEQSNSNNLLSKEAADREGAFVMLSVQIDTEFLRVYDIPLLAGRNFDLGIADDSEHDDRFTQNIIINELAMARLGAVSPADAIGRSFYDFPDSGAQTTYTVVGVVPDQNFQGFHNQIKPMAYFMDPGVYGTASVRVEGAGLPETMRAIEDVWDEIVPDYPLQARFLEDTFQEVYSIFALMNRVLGGFALVALTLSLIGLFGLAAFMAASRTKEIGLRKVMGANVAQIVRLLIWRLSRPVLAATVVALPAAWLAGGVYLNFFANRLDMVEAIIFVAGLASVLLAWAIVAIHAVRVARASPIQALRYE